MLVLQSLSTCAAGRHYRIWCATGGYGHVCMFAIAMKRADPTRQPLPAEMPSLPITDMKPMPYVSPHLFDMLPVPAIEQLVFGVLHACCHTHTT